jgi:hypothetical protein
MPNDVWKRELTIAAVLFAFGFFVLPLAIYWIGGQFIGQYEPGSGALTLADRFWSDLLRLNPLAWLLVLSPYLVVQLARIVRRTWRTRTL